MSQPVYLHLFDLSSGMASALSMPLLGKQVKPPYWSPEVEQHGSTLGELFCRGLPREYLVTAVYAVSAGEIDCHLE